MNGANCECRPRFVRFTKAAGLLNQVGEKWSQSRVLPSVPQLYKSRGLAEATGVVVPLRAARSHGANRAH